MLDNTKTAEPSLRDELVAAFNKSSEAESAPTESAPVESKAPAPAPKTESSPVESSRVDKVDASKVIDKAAVTNEADKPIAPPARWTKEEKEEFAGLDPRVQKILLGRNRGLEQDYTRKMMEIGEARRRFESVEKILAPRRQSWEQGGLNDEAALNQIFQYWDQAQRSPKEFIETFAQQRGIDLAATYAPKPDEIAAMMQRASGQQQATGNNGGAHATALHPAVAAEINTLKQHVTQQGQFLEQRARQEHAEVVNAAANELKAFIEATDEHGQSLHPFLNEVRADMKVLMEVGRAETLAQAYDMATRLNDKVSTQIRESQEIARRREDDSRRAAEAERARRAGSSISPSASGAAASRVADDNPDLSIRALLERGFASAKTQARI